MNGDDDVDAVTHSNSSRSSWETMNISHVRVLLFCEKFVSSKQRKKKKKKHTITTTTTTSIHSFIVNERVAAPLSRQGKTVFYYTASGPTYYFFSWEGSIGPDHLLCCWHPPGVSAGGVWKKMCRPPHIHTILAATFECVRRRVVSG